MIFSGGDTVNPGSMRRLLSAVNHGREVNSLKLNASPVDDLMSENADVLIVPERYPGQCQQIWRA